MDGKEYKRERRKQNRRERLTGSVGQACFVCHEASPNCLEGHHIAGKRFGDDRVTTCLNHHRKLTDNQIDEHPHIVGDNSPSTAERVGRLLLGIANCLKLINVPEPFVALLRRCGWELIENKHLLGAVPTSAQS